jgi:hypothetical protein
MATCTVLSKIENYDTYDDGEKKKTNWHCCEKELL